MEKHNFKKKFGQNFLRDSNIVEKIVRESNIEDNSLVIEIGPGDGALTKELLKVTTVLAYEIDNELKERLSNNLKDYTNIEIIYDDFLKRNIKEDIKKYKYDKLYVIANLPYYITTPILNKIIEEDLNLDKLVIMVQKEVGDRFSAKPGSRDYGSITVFLNYYFEIKQLFEVNKNSFHPKPNVDSVIVSFVSKKSKLYLKDEKHFFKLVKDSFKHKRKNIKNNLIEYDLAKIEEVLEKRDLSLKSRAEEIPLEIFAEISNNL